MNELDNLNKLLDALKISANCVAYRKVRNIGLYNLIFDIGARIKTLNPMLDEIAMALHAQNKPIVKLIPNEGIVRLEVIEEKASYIDFFDEFEKQQQVDGLLPVYLGNTVDGDDLIFDIAKNPHMIIAGATGAGKTTILNTLIGNLVQYDDVQTYLIDTKAIDYCQYQDRFNNLKIISSFDECLNILKNIQEVMNDRYETVRREKCAPDRYISSWYNEKKYIVIIDEFADLISQDENKLMQRLICNLTAKCRAAGIYFVLATQRPSVKILTGEIKANFPARISCKTSSNIDSRVILDQGGAENLAMGGDCIINNYANNFVRFQAAYSSADLIVKKLAN